MQRVLQIHPLSETSDYSYSFAANNANFLRFSPNTTRTYTFETSATSGDPYLEIYDHTMTRITYNDDGGDGNNALISCSLESGEVYYIKIRNYGNTAGYGNLYCSY